LILSTNSASAAFSFLAALGALAFGAEGESTPANFNAV
jgi:hypothetical protein